MGLYQLAEFRIQDENGQDTDGTIDAYFWWPHVGLIMELTFEGGGFHDRHVVALDGVAHINNVGSGSDSFWPAKNLQVEVKHLGGGVNGEVTYEPRVGVRGYTPDQQDVWPSEITNGTYLKFHGRRIRVLFDNLYEQRNGSEDLTVLGPDLPFSGQRVAVGRYDHDVMVMSHGADGNGAAVFYNTLTNELSKVYYIGEEYYFKYLFYVPEWKIFLTIHDHRDDPSGGYWLMKLWSMEVRPTIVTEPEVIAGTLRAGQVVTFRVQVTGNKEDPAEDELVEWVLTGDVGLLLDEQSKTDADGYATARVKIDVGETGTLDIEASVKC